jgi:prepilin-type processing-associated H-X9-DG protein
MQVTLGPSSGRAIFAAVSSLAVVTFLFATLALLRPAPHRPRRVAACLALFLAASSAGTTILLPSLERTHCGGSNLSCSYSLKQIGGACLLYANDHHNHYPPRLEDLILSGYLTTTYTLLCPTDSRPPAPGTTPGQLADSIAHGANCSYIYTAAGLTTSASPEAVLAYERFPNGHTSPSGFNVLFADGHTDFLSPADAPWLLDELASGHNPPRAETIPSYRP